MNSFITAGYACCVLLVAGCVSIEGSHNEQGGSDEQEVSESAEALGEIGCATAGGYPYPGGDGGVVHNHGTTQPAVLLPACGSGFNTATSPLDVYGTTSCPKQYILEVTNTLNRSITVLPSWAGQPLSSQSVCTAAKMQFGMYKRRGGNWALHGTTKYHGVWTGSSCQFAFDAGYSSLTLSTQSGSSDSDVTDIRVAGFAGVGIFRVSSQRVRIDLLNVRTCP